jgi:hypothetical protein
VSDIDAYRISDMDRLSVVVAHRYVSITRGVVSVFPGYRSTGGR